MAAFLENQGGYLLNYDSQACFKTIYVWGGFNRFRIDPFCYVLRISPRRPFSSRAKASPAVWSSSELAGVGFPGLPLSDGVGCLRRF